MTIHLNIRDSQAGSGLKAMRFYRLNTKNRNRPGYSFQGLLEMSR